MLAAPLIWLNLLLSLLLNLLLTRQKQEDWKWREGWKKWLREAWKKWLQESWNKWLQAAFAGIFFLAILIVVEWPFATFLMSPAARNAFFATVDFPYFALPTSPTVRHVFVLEAPSVFWRNMGLGFLFSVVSMRVGIVFGEWMGRVKR